MEAFEQRQRELFAQLEAILQTPEGQMLQWFQQGAIGYLFELTQKIEQTEQQAKFAGVLTPEMSAKILQFKTKMYTGIIESIYKPEKPLYSLGLLANVEVLKKGDATQNRAITSDLLNIERCLAALQGCGVDISEAQAKFAPIKQEAEDFLLQIQGGAPQEYPEMFRELVVSGRDTEGLAQLRRMGYIIGKYGGEKIPFDGKVGVHRHSRHVSDGVVLPTGFGGNEDATAIQSLRDSGRDVVGVILDRTDETGEVNDAVCYIAERNRK